VKLVVIMTITGNSPRMVIRTRICDFMVRPLPVPGMIPGRRSGCSGAAHAAPAISKRETPAKAGA